MLLISRIPISGQLGLSQELSHYVEVIKIDGKI
jgi:hypothetical protein